MKSSSINMEIPVIPAPSICTRSVSYNIITKPIKDIHLLPNALLKDDKKTYHYFRLLPDGRIIFGGEDTPFKGQISSTLAQKKYEELKKELLTLFPMLENQLEVEYCFCGAFDETDNNLGLIGKSEDPNIFYMLSCGANGVINAMYGAQLLIEQLNNKQPPLSNLFSPTRKA